MPEIEHILENRELFHKYMYTDFNAALEELAARKSDPALQQILEKYFPYGIPVQFSNGPRSVLFRQLATPNFEIRRFLFLTSFAAPKPLLWEYHSDKFTSHNPMKKHLGKLPIITGYAKSGVQQTEYQTIIDFNSYNGAAISDIKTLWGESLVDVHHRLFEISNTVFSEDTFFDASEWFKKLGGQAKDYYLHYLALFLSNAILFENFIIEDEHEKEFLKNVILPAIEILHNETGYKPLIVALEPTEIEGDLFWYSYPKEVGEYLKGKLESK